MKKKITALILLSLIASSALAVNSYLSRYEKILSPEAVSAAKEVQTPAGITLSQEELELFRLGYAFGYDAGNSAGDSLIVHETVPTYILNTASGTFHLPTCYMVNAILFENREDLFCTYTDAITKGYKPCGKCLKNAAP